MELNLHPIFLTKEIFGAQEVQFQQKKIKRQFTSSNTRNLKIHICSHRAKF